MSNITRAAAVSKPVQTGIHWKGDGWYASRLVRGVEVYYYLGPKRMPLLEAKEKAYSLALQAPVHITSKEGFTHVY